MASAKTITERLMGEVILYGGLPMRRYDVYRHALEATGCKRAADMFAFANGHVVDCEPLSRGEFEAITGEAP